MSSRSLEARSVGNAVKWSELLLNTFGPTTLRYYIDAKDMEMSQLFATTVASINAVLIQHTNSIDSLTTNKLNRTGDTAHGLSSDGWFTSVANTGWRTSYGSGFTQSNAARLEVSGSAILSAGNGVESSQYVALVTGLRSVFRFQQGAATSDFYRDTNGDVGLSDSVLGSIWRMVAASGDLEFNRRVKLNLSTIPGSGSYLGIDANGYLVRVNAPVPVGTPSVGSPVVPPVGSPSPVGSPVVPPVGSPVVPPSVGSPVVPPSVGSPVVPPVGSPVVPVGTPVGSPIVPPVGAPSVGSPVVPPVGSPVGSPVVPPVGSPVG